MKQLIVLLFALWTTIIVIPSLSRGADNPSKSQEEGNPPEAKTLGLAIGL